jgi:3-hydroxyacyl-[acyl-carrier-protein] dehydratase
LFPKCIGEAVSDRYGNIWSGEKMESWLADTTIDGTEPDGILADSFVAGDSPWFSGHFPGNPVLPGIAQLSLVFDLVRRIKGEGLKISRVRRVRFKQVIRPDDRFKVVLKQNSGDGYSYSFKIMLEDEVACSGIIVAAETEQELQGE